MSWLLSDVNESWGQVGIIGLDFKVFDQVGLEYADLEDFEELEIIG